MENKNAFGYVLRKVRQKTGITQEQLGHKSGLDRTYISLLERGLRQPTITTLIKISKALGVSSTSILKMVEELTNED